jgi:hypothetical protein
MIMSRWLIRLLALCIFWLACAPSAVYARPSVDPIRGGGMTHALSPYVAITVADGTSDSALYELFRDIGGFLVSRLPGRSTVVVVLPALQYAGPQRQQAMLESVRSHPLVEHAILFDRSRLVLGAAMPVADNRTARSDGPHLAGSTLEWALASGVKNQRSHHYAMRADAP